MPLDIVGYTFGTDKGCLRVLLSNTVQSTVFQLADIVKGVACQLCDFLIGVILAEQLYHRILLVGQVFDTAVKCRIVKNVLEAFAQLSFNSDLKRVGLIEFFLSETAFVSFGSLVTLRPS